MGAIRASGLRVNPGELLEPVGAANLTMEGRIRLVSV